MPNIIPVHWQPRSGGLNRDTDVQSLRDGDLFDALNIRSAGKGQSVSPDYENTVMNDYAYSVGNVTAQNKKWIINVDVGTVAVGDLLPVTIKDQNGNIITAATDWVLVGNDATTTLTNLTTCLDTILGAGQYSLTTNVLTTTTGTAEIEITTIPFNNYQITLDTSSLASTFIFSIFITQEAIDASLSGKQQCIGSHDLLGDSFQTWTSQTKLPSDISITGFADNGSGVVQITVADTTTLTDFSEVVISGGGGTVSIDGIWIISIQSATTIDVLGSTYGGVYTTPATMTINRKGIGEIGVAVRDNNTQVFSYTRLLRSIELNFNTNYQVDIDMEPTGDRKSMYFTDFNNAPRCFYYRGAYVQDGALTVVNSNNIYEYGTIDSETLLITSAIVPALTFLSQTQTGGNLLVDNYRYAIRFLTSSLSSTNWSDLSNPINVYRANSGYDPLLLWGDQAGEYSTKINNFVISNIPQNLFKYVELAAIRYGNAAVSGIIVKRQLLTSEAVQYISHSGYETTTIDLDLGTLNQLFAPIAKARNIAIINNRLTLSNITLQQVIDLTDFFQTWSHSIEKKTIPGVGSEASTPPTYSYAEYFDPLNLFNNVGYMMNETYRFMAKVKFKDKYGGFISPTFWIDDIRFDCEATNVTTPDRRVAGGGTNTDYDITTQNGGGDCSPYVWYVDFSGWDKGYLINGVPVSELIDVIFIERAVCVPEILASGYIVPAVSGVMQDSFAPPVNAVSYPTFTLGISYYGEFPYMSGSTFNTFNGWGGPFNPNNQDYPTAASGAAQYFTQQRKFGSLYFPDNFYSQLDIKGGWASGDSIYVYGSPEKGSFYPTNKTISDYQNQYTEYNGATGQTAKPTLNTIEELAFLEIGDHNLVFSGGTIGYSKHLGLAANFNDYSSAYQRGYVMRTTNDITDINTYGSTDYGMYIVQYYREISNYSSYDPDTCKYGTRIDTKSIPTGTSYQITVDTPAGAIPTGTVQVFGGDVLTQKTFFKFRYPNESVAGLTVDMGFGGGISFYSQNRMNSQMRRKQLPTSSQLYPKLDLATWLQNVINYVEEPNGELFYNSGYTIRNDINSNAAFDPNIEVQTQMITRIQYSDIKPQDSITDNYRYWPVLNFQDIDPTFGAIVSHKNMNGRLLAIQNRKLNLMFMNPAGLLSVVDGSEVIMGDGGRTLAQRPQTLSTYGSRHKWSVGIGKSSRGNDVIYFYDTEKQAICRWAGDGNTPISEVEMMRSFFYDEARWVYDYDTPANGLGVCFFWTDRYKEAGFTFRGHKFYDEWSDVGTYITGDHVSTDGTSTFEQTYDIYKALVDVVVGTPVTDTDSWELISHNNPSYYSEFTIVFSEMKNKFQSFHTYLPKVYMQFRDSYLSQRPVSIEQSSVFIHNEGVECVFYDDDTGSQAQDGYIEFAVSSPDGPKTYEAQRFDTLIVPKRVEWTTPYHESFAVDTDFNVDQGTEGFFDTPIFNDSTGTGVNTDDTSKLFGHWLLTKMFFESTVYQKLTSVYTKLWMRARGINN